MVKQHFIMRGTLSKASRGHYRSVREKQLVHAALNDLPSLLDRIELNNCKVTPNDVLKNRISTNCDLVLTH